jgi:hypothetical protein
MPHSFSHAPFRRRKDVVIAGPTAGLLCWHEAYAIRPGIYLPYPLPEVARQTRRHSGSTVFGGLGPEPLRGNAWVTGRCLGSIEPGNQRPCRHWRGCQKPRTWYGSYGTLLHWPSWRAELPV